MAGRMNYEDVDTRLHRFWEAFPDGRVLTELVHHDGERVVFRCQVWRDLGLHDEMPDASGYAEEYRAGGKKINEHWALENAETSAVGRALANLGLSPKGARPSSMEMGKRGRLEAVPDAPDDMATPAEIETLRAELNDLEGVARSTVRAKIEAAGLDARLPGIMGAEMLKRYWDCFGVKPVEVQP